MQSKSLKTTLIGESTTGKSTIVYRMRYNIFNCASECTIGASFAKLTYNDINYELWDTAGQERFFALLPMYFRGSRIILFVFDVSNENFKNIDSYIKLVDKIDNCQIIIIGNKIDLVKETELLYIKNNLKQRFDNSVIANKIYDYVFISAKSGKNFDNLMDILYKCALKIKTIDDKINKTNNDLDNSNNDIIGTSNIKLNKKYVNEWCSC